MAHLETPDGALKVSEEAPDGALEVSEAASAVAAVEASEDVKDDKERAHTADWKSSPYSVIIQCWCVFTRKCSSNQARNEANG